MFVLIPRMNLVVARFARASSSEIFGKEIPSSLTQNIFGRIDIGEKVMVASIQPSGREEIPC